MTEADLDDWIIEKANSHAVSRKMHDMPIDGVGVFYFVHMLNDTYGMEVDQSLLDVRASLTRLLKAGRIYAVGINGWSTYDGCNVTPQRAKDAREVIEGRREKTMDLWHWDEKAVMECKKNER